MHASQLSFLEKALAGFERFRVFDAGCGYGRYTQFFREVTGLDLLPERLRFLKAGIPEASVLVGDLVSLPFKNDAFSMSFTVGVLMHFPPEMLRNVISELIRVSAERIVHIEYFELEPRKPLAPHCFNHDLEGWYDEVDWCLVALEDLDDVRQRGWVFEP